MDTDEVEQRLRARSGHHDAELAVTELEGPGGWRAEFQRADGTAVLSADGTDRGAALQALYELDELEDLAGG
jgi:hypothetical protein